MKTKKRCEEEERRRRSFDQLVAREVGVGASFGSPRAVPRRTAVSRTTRAMFGRRSMRDLQRGMGNAAVRRLIEGEEEVRREPMAVDVKRVQERLGSGSPLDQETREYMEWRFGVSFEEVRIHTGPTADELARDLQAHAFAIGANVAFGRNRYRPGSREGDRLLAHELMHVVQNGKARPLDAEEHDALGGGDSFLPVARPARSAPEEIKPMMGNVSEPDDAIEIEAERAADAVIAVPRSAQSKAREEQTES